MDQKTSQRKIMNPKIQPRAIWIYGLLLCVCGLYSCTDHSCDNSDECQESAACKEECQCEGVIGDAGAEIILADGVSVDDTQGELDAGVDVIHDDAFSDAVSVEESQVETEIIVLEGEKSYCPEDVGEGVSCAARPSVFWWCTHPETCDIWGCSPASQGGQWILLETAPAGGCTQGCPNDFDAAAEEMEYCEGMVCLEKRGNACRELRCINGPGYDHYVLSEVECPLF